MNLSDDPIGHPPDDLLGRDALATTIATLIASSSDSCSYRVGVLGTWGAGKSSVLHLVRSHLPADKYLCVWVAPWTATSASQAIQQLLDAICAELNLKSNWRLKASRFMKRSGSIASIACDLDTRVKLATTVVATALQGVNASVDRRLAEDLLGRISDELESRRLVIFVDDLDRARPEIVPEILLIFREALGLPRFHYVLALDPHVVSGALAQVHRGYKDAAQSFLEKIIEYPFHLSSPSEADIAKLTRRLVTSAASTIDKQTLRDISSYLPRNPRSLKLFLRYLAGLSGLDRFSPHEISLPKLYLAQLLRLEFPEEARRLAEDEEAVKEIDRAVFGAMMRDRQRDEKPKPPKEEEHAPSSETRRARFLDLCLGLREAGAGQFEYSTGDLITVAERPPVVTRKELEELTDELIPLSPKERHTRLQVFIERSATPDGDLATALFAKALTARDRVLSAAADQDAVKEIVAALEPASALTCILDHVLVRLNGLDEGLVSTDDWVELVKHCARWSKFRGAGLEYYHAARASEAQVLRDAIAAAGNEAKVALMGTTTVLPAGRLHEIPESLRDLTQELGRAFAIAAADLALERFERADGLSVYWGQRTGHLEKVTIFDRNSPFHSMKSRQELKRISERAVDDQSVQGNLLEYLRMILYGATDATTSFPQADCQDLLRDRTFVTALWIGAVASPLNLRTVGSLRNLLATAEAQSLFSSSELEKPAWWVEYEQWHFTSKEGDEGTSADVR